MQRLVWSSALSSYVPLGQVADGVRLVSEDTLISRFDRARTISIRAEPRDGENSNEAHERIRPLIEGIELRRSTVWSGVATMNNRAKPRKH